MTQKNKKKTQKNMKKLKLTQIWKKTQKNRKKTQKSNENDSEKYGKRLRKI